MVVDESEDGPVLVPVEDPGRPDPEPPGAAGWRVVAYQEMQPFDGAVQVVKVFVPWSGFARARAVGMPLTEPCLPSARWEIN